MAEATVRFLDSTVALRLGRVSNLPTVWTNVLAGASVAGGSGSVLVFVILVLAISLIYVAGMFLNDYFDRDFDSQFRPERPIPAGQVQPRVVLLSAIGMVAAALVLLIMIGLLAGPAIGQRPLVGGLALVGMVFAYDVWHKSNSWSPVLMGACRAMVYVIAAISVSGTITLETAVVCAAAACYVAGLTYAAKHENLLTIGSVWPLVLLSVPVLAQIALPMRTPLVLAMGCLLVLWTAHALSFHLSGRRRNTPRAVAGMIAGLSVVDALFIAQMQRFDLVLVALIAFLLTLQFQKRIAGT